MADNHFDIVIVGAGLVGASLACAIAGSPRGASLRLALVEPGPVPAVYEGEEFDPRVVALTRRSQAFLEAVDVWSTIAEQRVCPYTGMYVWDGDGTASIEFDSRAVREENLGHIVENSLVLKAPLERLAGYPGVSFFRGCKVERIHSGFADSRVGQTTLVLDNDETLVTSLVLAADGANSKIRELLAMKTRAWDYGQDAVVTTVRTEKPHRHIAWQRFSREGPLAFLPLTTAEGDLHYSSIVWSVERDLAAQLMAMDDAQFARSLASSFEFTLGEITRVARRFSFPLWQRHAVDYVRPGFALVGDAAHSIHPLAGQGVNLGLADAQQLAKEIERALGRHIPLTDYSILRRYARARKGENLAMMAVMEGFKRLFGHPGPGLQLIRNAGMRQVDHLPALKNLIARQAMGLTGH